MNVVARGLTVFYSVRDFSGRLSDRSGAEEEMTVTVVTTWLKVIGITLTLLDFMSYPYSVFFVVDLSCFWFFFQCFNSVLESSFDSQVTKGKKVSMEPLAQGLQEDLVSFLLEPI